MRIYCVQLDIVWEDKAANHAKVRRMLENARPEVGSLVLLPEMFSTGFSMNVGTVADDVSRADQEFIPAVAREFGVTVVAGLVLRDRDGKGLNQAMVCDASGNEIARYTKLQCFSPGKEAIH